MFWDGFQWVQKGNTVAALDPTHMAQTKKMRRVQISNLPLYLNLREEDVLRVVNDFLIRNYLNDEGNQTPVMQCELNHANKTAVVELSSVEEASRLAKIEHMSILEVKCKITRLGESMYGVTTNLATLLNNANVNHYLMRPKLMLKQLLIRLLI